MPGNAGSRLRQPPIRRRTLAAGAALGVLLLSALTLAGILGAQRTPRQPQPPAADPVAPHIASQPELAQALLSPVDLPSAYASQPAVTVRRLPRPDPELERCSALLDPQALVRDAAARVAPRYHAQAATGPALPLNQVLTSFPGTGAADTLRELQRIGEQCRDFRAVLSDGAPVRVRVQPAEPQGVRDEAATYTMKVTMIGASGEYTGYLALGQIGQTLSVIQQLQPAATGETTPVADLLDQAVRKLLPLAAMSID